MIRSMQGTLNRSPTPRPVIYEREFWDARDSSANAPMRPFGSDWPFVGWDLRRARFERRRRDAAVGPGPSQGKCSSTGAGAIRRGLGARVAAPIRPLILFSPRRPTRSGRFNNCSPISKTGIRPRYHHWLTPAQYGSRFGVSDATYAAVADWLRTTGLTVGALPPGRGHLTFFGSKTQIEGALRTRIHLFDVEGGRHYANVSAPMVPAALQTAISAVRGLTDFIRRRESGHEPPLLIYRGRTGGVRSPWCPMPSTSEPTNISVTWVRPISQSCTTCSPSTNSASREPG